MGKLVKSWTNIPMLLRMFVGLVVGIILAIVAKDVSWISVFGKMFVGLLKAIAPILVFFLVSASIMKMKSDVGNRFVLVIILYITTVFGVAFLAAIISVCFPVKLVLINSTIEETALQNVSEIFNMFLTNIVENPISATINGKYIGVLFWAIIFGFCMKNIAKPETNDMFTDVAKAISKSVEYIVELAPFGVMGLIYEAITTNGMDIFYVYGNLLLVLVGTMFFVYFIVNPIIIACLLKKNPYPLIFICLRESGITAFLTRSSAANIPINMKLCEKLGIDENFYSVSISLGATINMSGAVITIMIMTMAMCHTVGVVVSPIMMVVLSIVAVIGAGAASGVASGALFLIPMACSVFGISYDMAMEAVAVGFVIGIIQDSVETVLNSTGDVIWTATAEYMDRKKQGKDMRYLGEFANNKK